MPKCEAGGGDHQKVQLALMGSDNCFRLQLLFSMLTLGGKKLWLNLENQLHVSSLLRAVSILSGAEYRQLSKKWVAINPGSRDAALRNQAETPDSARSWRTGENTVWNALSVPLSRIFPPQRRAGKREGSEARRRCARRLGLVGWLVGTYPQVFRHGQQKGCLWKKKNNYNLAAGKQGIVIVSGRWWWPAFLSHDPLGKHPANNVPTSSFLTSPSSSEIALFLCSKVLQSI